MPNTKVAGGPGENLSGHSLAGKRILLAEDALCNQRLAVATLTKAGMEVTIANNGAEAVELVKEQNFDLVIMDIMMPVMDGLTAAHQIRQLSKPGAATLPILAFTASENDDDVRASINAGMNGYLCKPYPPAALLQEIGRLLQLPCGTVAPAAEAQQCSETNGESPPPPLPADWEEGIRQIGGNRDLHRQLLRQFVKDYRATAEEVRTEVEKGNRCRAADIAHSIKSAAGLVAALQLQTIASNLETALRKGSECCDPLLALFVAEFDAVLTAVDKHLATGKTTTHPS